MKFIIYLDVYRLPRAFSLQKAPETFEKMSEGRGNTLIIWGTGSRHTICLRNGANFEVGATNQADIVTIEFDDFRPGLSPEDMPEWYERLKDRIVSVHGEECYGRAQGIFVTERISHGCAVGIVRNLVVELGPRKTPELVYAVKLFAKGSDSLSDALKLHQQILTGE